MHICPFIVSLLDFMFFKKFDLTNKVQRTKQNEHLEEPISSNGRENGAVHSSSFRILRMTIH